MNDPFSESDTIDVEVTFNGLEWQCNCDTLTWDCKFRDDGGGMKYDTEVEAAARVRLYPNGARTIS